MAPSASIAMVRFLMTLNLIYRLRGKVRQNVPLLLWLSTSAVTWQPRKPRRNKSLTFWETFPRIFNVDNCHIETYQLVKKHFLEKFPKKLNFGFGPESLQ